MKKIYIYIFSSTHYLFTSLSNKKKLLSNAIPYFKLLFPLFALIQHKFYALLRIDCFTTLFLSLSSSHDFFFLYTVPRKKEFQSNLQINLLVFFSPHKVQIIKNHVRDHIRRIRVVVRTSLLNVSTNTAILEPHISLIFSSFFFSFLLRSSPFFSKQKIGKLLSGREQTPSCARILYENTTIS